MCGHGDLQDFLVGTELCKSHPFVATLHVGAHANQVACVLHLVRAMPDTVHERRYGRDEKDHCTPLMRAAEMGANECATVSR